MSFDERTALLSRTLETIPDLVWLKSTDGVYLFCNPAFSRFFGASEAGIVGKTDYDFVDSEIADTFRENDRRAMDAGCASVNEKWITFADDGRRALVETVKTPMYDEAGQLLGILGVAREVTELRAAQEALAQREQYLRALIDNFPFLVWLKDTSGRFLTVNEAFASACEAGPAAEIAGKTDFDVWPSELASAYQADDAAVMDSRAQRSVEEEIVEQGVRTWFETYKAPVSDSEGELLGTVGFARDVSHRKLAEETLRSHNALLAGLSGATGYILSAAVLSDKNITDALRAIGEAADVDRAYIFEHKRGPDGSRGTISQRYEWSSDGVEPQISNPDLQGIPWDDIAPRWHDEFVAGGYIAGHVADFPADERAALDPQGILSLLALPIELDGQLWGFIGFDACTALREWDVFEVGLLRAVGDSVGVAIGRMRAEAALRESEANFRTFFESVDDMIVVGTPDGRIVYSNPAVSAKLGHSPAEIAELTVLELHPADRRNEAEAIFGAMFRGERDACPLPLQCKSGELVSVETRVWFGSWNGADCIFGVSKDITTEQEALQKFDRIFRSNPAPMAVSDVAGGQLTDVNDAFLTTFGYTRDEVIGVTSVDIGLFVDQNEQRSMADELILHGRIAERELKVRRKDGTQLDGLFSGELIRSQQREHFLTVMTDITKIKEAERVLHTWTSVIDVVGNVTEMRDPYTAGHQRRVAHLAAAIALDLGLSAAEIEDVRMAGLMLDVGKVAVPAEILSKPGALSPNEFKLVEAHVEAGRDIIASAKVHGPIAEYVYQHHERCDGSGYPRGLTGDDLLLGSKILMVSDVVEAMLAHRPHRAALALEDVLGEIESGAGTRYDAAVAESCLRLVGERGFDLSAV